MSKKQWTRDNLPTIRIPFVYAAEIYYYEKYSNKEFVIKNQNDCFDNHFSDLMPVNLDLIYLLENDKLPLHELGEELYSFAFVNVSFKYPVFVKEDGERAFKGKDGKRVANPKQIRKYLYLNGFKLNGKEYVRYKRSAGSAKKGNCLFILKSLFPMMDRWSRANLDEEQCLQNLTSYEAYKALSLSSLISTFELNPYNILFVKDHEVDLPNQDVIRITHDEKKGLVASRENCTVKKINVFDGEGLIDATLVKQYGHGKGMMLLRNRYFKCCAFNTNLQAWFRANNITSVDQLHGYTFAESIEDILLVVSESCLKYVKMCNGGFTKENIKKWCDAISNENHKSLFGLVKTDKETRFFDGDMVETTYQMLNTLQLSYSEVQSLFRDYIFYINGIRNIKETPECIKLYLKGEANINDFDELIYTDDSEDQGMLDDFFDYSSYSFKSKVCYDLIEINKQFVYTELFKDHVYKDIIKNFRLRLYDGRVLIDGTWATLFGNPLEYLQYILKLENRIYQFKDNSFLKENEIYCSFFGNEKLVGSRAPHIVAGNLLLADNRKIEEIDKWFNLTRNIVVVDAIRNNIQQRLNGMDYDSDQLLLTNNSIILGSLTNDENKNYKKFPVPYADFGHVNKKLRKLSKDKNENIKLNLFNTDEIIANNITGQIINLSQKLNSHLWDKINKKKSRFNYIDLYKQIAILAVLAGAEIDSSKRSFPFKTKDVLNNVEEYAAKHGYDKPPVFFYYVAPGKKEKPRIGAIEKYACSFSDNSEEYLNTTMDHLWKHIKKQITGERVDTVDIKDLINEEIGTAGLSGLIYDQKKNAEKRLTETRDILNKEKFLRRFSTTYDLEKRNFSLQIANCYKEIKTCLKTPARAILLIKSVADKPSLLVLLLYIISIKEKELGYGYEDLFIHDQDDGIASLERTNDPLAKFTFFGKYHYEKSLLDKIVKKIKRFENN